jgi:hypothetical protein
MAVAVAVAMGMVICIDRVGGEEGETVAGVVGLVVVVVSDELVAVVIQLPALSSHVCQWYIE